MKSFSILEGKAHVVELPESDNPFRDLGVAIKSELDNKVSGKLHARGKNGWESVDLPPGTWQIVSTLAGVSEEWAKGVVYTGHIPNGIDVYWDYENECYFDYSMTAIESLESAILAEGWYFQHPQGDTPIYYTDKFTGKQKVRLDWQQAQSRVLCGERCLVLRRVDG